MCSLAGIVKLELFFANSLIVPGFPKLDPGLPAWLELEKFIRREYWTLELLARERIKTLAISARDEDSRERANTTFILFCAHHLVTRAPY